jgi:hypothetical protein
VANALSNGVLVFGLRNGKVRFDLRCEVQRRGFHPIDLRDAEYHAISRDCAPFKAAVRRRIRAMTELIASAAHEGDKKAGKAFGILRRWARRMLRHLMRLEK